MIPSALSTELCQGLADFLRASFWSNAPGFEDLIDRLVSSPGALTQGPYLSLKLPFARGQVGPEFFPAVPMGWPPHAHQERAFARLSGPRLEHTLVATGTGSGKTESFLLPILDHCARHAGERGVKALLIYPMNALATDQARRLAALIDQQPQLKGRVTAGLFVGQAEKRPWTTMGPENILTDRDIIADNPPDILLTNYKMLDYLLMRPRDQRLWADNGPQTLRFLVVDEIHTFDGAQGTDLACLLRRLKVRLGTPPGSLCCVGTSATLGGPEAAADLLQYASRVFGEPFPQDAIVGEERLAPGQFLEGHFPEHLSYPTAPSDLPAMRAATWDSQEEYLRAQARTWFQGSLAAPGPAGLDDAWRLALGQEIKKHVFLQQLLAVMGGQVRSLDQVVEAFRARLAPFRRLDDTHARALVMSFVALLSAARAPMPETPVQRARRQEEGRAPGTLPFMQVQLQLWLREMRRMVASVEARPSLRFGDDLHQDQLRNHLPVIYCPHCGLMGWASKVSQDRSRDLSVELRDFYASFFDRDPRVELLYPEGVVQGQRWDVNPRGLRRELAQEGQPPPAGWVRLVTPGNVKQRGSRQVLSTDCPRCGAREDLTLLGYRAATLTSALINQIYASRFNDDKKLLTFSDSVQDAAHRAGFFGARTWKLNLRVATQQALQARQGLPPLPLGQVAAWTLEHWGAHMAPEELIATLIPPQLETSPAFLKLKEKGALTQAEARGLLERIARRLDWEAFAEYGMGARVGRTLPRAACSVASLQPHRLEQAAAALLPRLQNSLGGLRQLALPQVQVFLLGLCRRWLSQGAVFQPELPQDYLDSGGKQTWHFSRQPHLPNYGPRSRLPIFPTMDRAVARLEPLLTRGGSWYQRWWVRALAPHQALVAPDHLALYQLSLEALRQAGVLRQRDSREGPFYGLDPQCLEVSLDPQVMRCQACSALLPVDARYTQLWQGAPCLEVGCQGHYAPAGSRPLSWYRRMYQRGEVHRVVTAEHTSLLTRDARQDVEERFKAPTSHRWEPNLLSCTPTLEMGIDIGALSVAILCSVPPAQANYLQRVGRAGRRDGNALLLTVAGADPHDLYFYHEPTEMIAGQVKPPGVYLNASAVLERQLTAFCIDRWVQQTGQQAQLPKQLKEIFSHLEASEGGAAPTGFPHDLLAFIQVHQASLLEQFLGLFLPEETGQEARQHLQRFLLGDAQQEASLRWKILHALVERRREYEALKAQLPRLSRRLRALKKVEVKDEGTQEEIEALEREHAALSELARSMREARTLEVLTDDGLLPNYAFPESGVTLRSVISRRKREGAPGEGEDKKQYKKLTYDYVRPAMAAISELAPDNYFYADGYKVRIEKVDLAINKVEPWRFCDRCDCARPIAGTQEQRACPSCGSPYWSDASQRRDMLKLRQVFAWSPESRVRIADDSEERTPTFYNRQTLVSLEERGQQQGWVIDHEQAPFGFEYIRRATLREVNFGPHSDRGLKLSVGGQSSVRQGFQLCRECGTVQRRLRRKGDPAEDHDHSCRFRGAQDGASLMDCLYLYREVRSEAVRLLLPFLEEEGGPISPRQQSFIAALQMGLADFFGGSIDHLRATTYTEPVPHQSTRRPYLLLYDSIPGGTGYLKELVRAPEKVFAILERALGRLKSCACNQDPDRDGCYRCLLAYRSSREMSATSRDLAVELLHSILRHKDRLKPTEDLSQVPLNALFDSILEARFIESLGRGQVGQARLRPQVTREIVRGAPGYSLKLGVHRWLIQPQVDLGLADGVALRCRPDFVLWPASSEDPRRPVAVFTDGLAYHKDRLEDDARKRAALLHSGRFLVWSLNWDDVQEALQQKTSAPWVAPLDQSPRLSDWVRKLTGALHSPPGTGALLQTSSHHLLLHYLAHRDPPNRAAAQVLALAPLLGQRLQGDALQAATDALSAQASPEALDFLLEHAELGAHLESRHLSFWALASTRALQTSSPEAMSLAVVLRDEPEQRSTASFKQDWRDFLRLLNLFQFLPRFWFTASGAASPEAAVVTPVQPPAPVAEPATTAGQPEPDATQSAWAELLRFGDGYEDLLGALRLAGCAPPLQGFEPVNEHGHPEGLAELAWEERRLAILYQGDDPAPFMRRGWTVLYLEDVLEDVPSLLHHLEEA